MCEFCVDHGEGKKWYLEMKNYAEELLYEELTSDQKNKTGATTRYEWNNRFWESLILPAFGGVSKPREETQDSSSTVEATSTPPRRAHRTDGR